MDRISEAPGTTSRFSLESSARPHPHPSTYVDYLRARGMEVARAFRSMTEGEITTMHERFIRACGKYPARGAIRSRLARLGLL